MNAKQIYGIAAILLGYGLIIGGFIVFGKSLENNIKILDIVVSCLIFTPFVRFCIFPVIDFRNSSHKEVGMMGIHYFMLTICCTIAFGIMVFGIICDIEFKYQLMGQLIVLFLTFGGRFVTLDSGEQVQRVYEKEQISMQGKDALQSAMDNLMDEISRIKTLDASAKQRLEAIHESLRFITPSVNPEACDLEAQYHRSIEELRIFLRNTNLNQEKISEEIEQLERILSKRKKY